MARVQGKLYVWQSPRLQPEANQMDESSAVLFGELNNWPSKGEMAGILSAAGLRLVVGRCSIRIEDCSHFILKEYGCDLGPPSIEANADSVDHMLRDGGLVSNALAQAGLHHRFEIHNELQELVSYLHHNWPAI